MRSHDVWLLSIELVYDVLMSLLRCCKNLDGRLMNMYDLNRMCCQGLFCCAL